VSAADAGWRLEVDREKCIGSGICVGMAPRYFSLVSGASMPATGTLPPDEAMIDAADTCPVEAISVYDAANDRLLAPEA
jgi:ferredoxin